MALPSLGEGLPMAVIEAFSFGIPVVATAVGGLPQAICEGRNGFLIERSVEAMAAALRRVIVDTKLHAELSRGARQKHMDEFSLEVMGAAYERLYFEDGH